MKKNQKTIGHIRLGITIIAGIFLFYFGINFLKGSNIFERQNIYYGYFDNLDGLVKSSQVYIKGYKVGQVSDIQYDFSKKESFKVQISVDHNIKLPEGTRMILSDDGLLGGKVIRLDLEDLASNSHKNEENILATFTENGMLDNLTAQLVPKLESTLSQVDSLLSSVRTMVDNPSIEASLLAIEQSTKHLAKTSSQLDKIANTNLQDIISNVDDIMLDLSSTTNNIKNIDFASTVNQVDNTINDLNEFTSKLNSSDNSLGLLVNDKNLYDNLNSTAESANALLFDLKANPKRYVNFSLFGGKAEKQ